MASAVAMAVIGSASERNHSVEGVLKVIKYSIETDRKAVQQQRKIDWTVWCT